MRTYRWYGFRWHVFPMAQPGAYALYVVEKASGLMATHWLGEEAMRAPGYVDLLVDQTIRQRLAETDLESEQRALEYDD